MNDWKKALRERFSDASMPEPEGLWDGIEEGLSGSRKKVIPLLWPLLGAVAAAVAALILLPGRSVVPAVPGAVAVVTEEAVPEPVQEAVPTLQAADEWVPGEIPSRPRPVSRPLPNPVRVVSDTPTEIPSDLPEVPTSHAETSDNPIPSENPGETPESESVKTLPEKERKPDPDPVVFPDEDPLPERRPFLRNIQIGARTSGTNQNTSTTTRYGFGIPETRGELDPTYSIGLPYAALANTENETTVNQGLPIRYGLILAFRVAPRWTVETGFLQSYRRIDTRIVSSYMTTVQQRSTRYYGIPLNVHYGITDPGRPFSLYATLGALWEKADRDKTITTAQIGTYSEKTEKTDPDPDASLWSAIGGIGLQVRPVQGWPVTLFAEPGVNWIVREREKGEILSPRAPFQFSLAAGVRFTIAP